MVFLNWLQKLKSDGNEAKILILGLDNSGKTTILKRLSFEDVTETTPTQGFNVRMISPQFSIVSSIISHLDYN
jgi:ADP-ribosylation factor-like protein 3